MLLLLRVARWAGGFCRTQWASSAKLHYDEVEVVVLTGPCKIPGHPLAQTKEELPIDGEMVETCPVHAGLDVLRRSQVASPGIVESNVWDIGYCQESVIVNSQKKSSD